MFRGLIVLIAANALGEALRRGFGLPVSGPVLGMILLFLLFTARRGVPAEVERTSQPLLQHLSLFFVPAGVGVITHFEVIGREWPAMALALVGSSVLGLLATAAALHGMDRLAAQRPGHWSQDPQQASKAPAPELRKEETAYPDPEEVRVCRAQGWWGGRAPNKDSPDFLRKPSI